MRRETRGERRAPATAGPQRTHDGGTGPGPEAPACPRCATRLFPAELGDGQGHKILALRCILCGTYVEPGHVPDTVVVRTVRGPRGPRN
jgi:hypothetical protein